MWCLVFWVCCIAVKPKKLKGPIILALWVFVIVYMLVSGATHWIIEYSYILRVLLNKGSTCLIHSNGRELSATWLKKWTIIIFVAVVNYDTSIWLGSIFSWQRLHLRHHPSIRFVSPIHVLPFSLLGWVIYGMLLNLCFAF